MRTSDCFGQGRTVFSVEVFPPKRDTGLDGIQDTIRRLSALPPDFISVTYGAGGSENSGTTIDLARLIKSRCGVESVAHLPCLALTRQEARDILARLRDAGIENVLALRGDRGPAVREANVFRHAADLVEFIRGEGGFNVIAAAYPEGHNEAPSIEVDVRHLREKVDAGASQLITQLFFDNDNFYRFRDRCEKVGIDVPIEAGIMPVLNKRQIERMVTLCKVKLPRKFVAVMERYGDDPDSMHDAGLAYAIDQIVDLVAQGVDGIHLYTMNRAEVAMSIHSAVRRLIRAPA